MITFDAVSAVWLLDAILCTVYLLLRLFVVGFATDNQARVTFAGTIALWWAWFLIETELRQFLA